MATTEKEQHGDGSLLSPLPARSLELESLALLDWDQWNLMTKPERRLTLFDQLQQLTPRVNELIMRENRRQQLKRMGEG